MYTLDQRNSIIYQAQVKLGEIGYTISLRERTSKPCNALYDQGYHISVGLRVLLNKNLENNLTTDQIDKLLSCMVKLAGIDEFPVSNPLVLQDPPSIIIGEQGEQGPPGPAGPTGPSARDTIKVISTHPDVGVVDPPYVDTDEKLTYELIDTRYVAPQVVVSFDDAVIIDPDEPDTVQQGVNIPTLPINITITKGRDNVTSATITPASLDSAFQAALDLNQINNNGSQTFQIITTNIDADLEVVVTAIDGVNNGSGSDSIKFVFPFLYGGTASDSPNHYPDLNKLIQSQGDKTVPFLGTSQYFWFGYPSSYPVLKEIRDQNQNNVTVLFIFQNSVPVTSTGLDTNWTQDYVFYRTAAATDIANFNYTFIF